MAHLHIIGFRPKQQASLKIGYDWHPEFPKQQLDLDKNEAIILNLNEVHDSKTIIQIQEIVEFIKANGGTLVVVTAPYRMLSHMISNYQFLPWNERDIRSIMNFSTSYIKSALNAPSWINSFLHGLEKKLVSPVHFRNIPSTTQLLMRSGGGSTVSLNIRHEKGKILIIPPIKEILHGESGPSYKREIGPYLNRIVVKILSNFWKPSDERPSWLDSIFIPGEKELREEFQSLKRKLEKIDDEKSILADGDKSLTRKVTGILQSLGFQAEDKEDKFKEDIEIVDGDYIAKVECTGKKANLQYGKFRQLMDYLIDADEGTRGMFILNPQKIFIQMIETTQ